MIVKIRGFYGPVAGASYSDGCNGQGGVAAAGDAYLHDPKTGGFISLDTPQSLAAKGRYARQEGLAGLFAWELTQDDGTLVEAMASASKGE